MTAGLYLGALMGGRNTHLPHSVFIVPVATLSSDEKMMNSSCSISSIFMTEA